MIGIRALDLSGPDWHVYPLPAGSWRNPGAFDGEPADREHDVPAAVPGTAHGALVDSGALPHPYGSGNGEQWFRTREQDWVFNRVFALPVEFQDLRVWLRLAAVAGTAHLFLNGRAVGEVGGRAPGGEFDVTSAARVGAENRLTVVVEPEREILGPGLPPAGLPGAVSLRATGPAGFRQVAVYSNVATDRSEASLSIVSEFHSWSRMPAVVTVEILRDGLPVAGARDPVTLFDNETSLVQSARLRPVSLWWPNGMGEQPLYEARLAVQDSAGTVLDLARVVFGVRAVELAAGTADQPSAALVVNGERRFFPGWTWLPADPLGVAGDPGHRTRLVSLAVAAGAACLYVPACNGAEPDEFYDECDRSGILIWQDLPSGADPREVAAIVERLRNHPSVAVWSGSHAADEVAAESLGQDVALFDPQRPWTRSAPSDAQPTALGAAQRDGVTVQEGGNERSASVTEHADEVERLFGTPADPDAFTRSSQWLQAEALRCAVEAARRAPLGSTLFPWSLNESAPEAVGPSEVDWSGRPKAAYWAVRRAYAPLHVSAVCSPGDWQAEAEFRADVWVYNSTSEERSLLNVAVTISTLDGRILYQENLAAEAPAGGAENAGDVRWRFPQDFAEVFLVHLEVINEEGERLAENAYLHSRAPAPALSLLLAAPPAMLEVLRAERGVTIWNTARSPAIAVTIDAQGETTALPGDNWFILPGGAERLVPLSAAGSVRVEAWNAEPVLLDA